MDHPEICGKHEFNDTRTWKKDANDQQTQLRITLRCNRFNPQLGLCHKTLEDKTSGLKGRIQESCLFAAYVRVVGGQVRDEYDYMCKISTYGRSSVLSIL